MAKQRISYVPLEKMDAEMRKEMERCQREGTPRPESSAVRAHVPAAFWFFANSWHNLFRNGVLDHAIKELCRLYVSRSVQCEYCGNQRSVKATTSGALIEDHVMDLLNFEKSTTYNERQKAALAYAEAITWHLNTDDAFWDRMHKQFSEPELVELGCMIGLTLGQQSWLRLLNIEHHQVLAGTDASMAPGYKDMAALQAAKAAPADVESAYGPGRTPDACSASERSNANASWERLRVNSDALVGRPRDAACPAHNGVKSGKPRRDPSLLSACTAPAAAGN